MSRPLRLLVVAGEVSGDLLAAGLLEALRDRVALVEAFGIGGDRLRAAGMETLRDVHAMSAVGFGEVLRRIPFYRRVMAQLVEQARMRQPDAAILVDYPGFNLRLAARLKRMGIRVIYYVCPQVWAWHRSRIPRLARIVDRLLVLFPFEVGVFAGMGLAVEWVGHPMVDDLERTRQEKPPALPWQGGHPRIALLPGSRPQEIERLLPLFWQAALEIEHRRPEAAFLVATPSAAVTALVRAVAARLGDAPDRMEIVEGRTRPVLLQADAALVASGTATLETALLGCPMAIAYRGSAFNYAVVRRLIRIPHVGLPNIIAGRLVCPEFLQGAARPEALAAAVLAVADEGPSRRRMTDALEQVRAAIGPPGASARAAAAVLNALGVTPAAPPAGA
jgi:lipid-A-disaccharide synthase